MRPYAQAEVNSGLVQTGVIPRTLPDSPYWNGKDSAADNYRFMVLTAWFTVPAKRCASRSNRESLRGTRWRTASDLIGRGPVMTQAVRIWRFAAS